MGQTLEKPVTEKDTHKGANNFLTYGCSSMQGYRVTMEDRHNTDGQFELPDGVKAWVQKSNTELSYFGVYDGHSGDGCAHYLSQNLLKNVISEVDKTKDETKIVLADDEIIKNGFMNTDQDFQNKMGSNDSGTTANTAFIRKTDTDIEVICANTGDSRCVLYNEGHTEAMSKDHKPVLEEEKKRIKEAGGYVEFGRVNGTLAVSRAFGDLIYKENSQLDLRRQAVTALPDIKRYQVKSKSQSGDYRFIVLACDGVWDVMSNEEVTKYVKGQLDSQKSGEYWKIKKEKLMQQNDVQGASKVQQPTSGFDLGAICEDLLDHVVLDLDSKDNVSVIVVLF